MSLCISLSKPKQTQKLNNIQGVKLQPLSLTMISEFLTSQGPFVWIIPQEAHWKAEFRWQVKS